MKKFYSKEIEIKRIKKDCLQHENKSPQEGIKGIVYLTVEQYIEYLENKLEEMRKG